MPTNRPEISRLVRDHSFPGVEDAFGRGDVVLFAPPDLPYSGRICAARYNITMLDPALLGQVAAGGPRGDGPVRLTGHRPHSAAAARYLSHAIAHLRDHVPADLAVADQPLIASTAAHVTVRAQYAFRRHLGTTPLAHLPRVRLAHAHHDLVTAAPDSGTTVTECPRTEALRPGTRSCWGN
ncbi:hypothetical protein [Streptomyces collinus]|uniref:hypothetical protein n=1 Tax=Streptomyces collinus TaxID=42684 RepID=UPI002943E150|nr:hypothetical protein [Streptomyces collinus]